jgi:methylamine---glutamate N-methyltransferase subunit B
MSTDLPLESDASAELSIDGLSPPEVRRWLDQLSLPADQETSPLVRLVDAAGADHMLMALDQSWRLRVEGSLGDYTCAFNRQSEVRIIGDVGHGVADGMISGAVRVRGNAGDGAGIAMTGGTLAIYGRAGHGVATALRGGDVFVRGNCGDAVGAGALRGTIVLGGDAGERLGEGMYGATIFIRGRAASLGEGVVEAPLRERERLRLGLLLMNVGIKGEAKAFRRVVAQSVLQAEAGARRGEVNPSWR